MPKKLIAVICLALVMFFDYAALGKPDLNIEVAPTRFELRLPPAETVSGTILLKNRCGKRVSVSVTVNDWDMSINGFSAFFNPASRKDSCAGWITLNPRKFMIDTAKQQMVRFTMQRPPDATVVGESRCAVFFNTQAAVPDKNNPTGNLAAVVAIYCNAPGVQRQGRIIRAESHYDGKQKTVESLLEAESTGTAHIRFQGVFDVKDENGKTVSAGSYYGNVIFPGRRLLLKGICQRQLAPGKYTVESFLKFQQPSYATGATGWEEYSGGIRQLTAESEFVVHEGE